MSSPAATLERKSPNATIGVIILIAAIAAALAALDLVLENAEDAEAQSSAEAAYKAGQNAMKSGHTDIAIEYFRKAHAAVRHNATYELALIEGLVLAGRIADAEPLINEVLQNSPNYGPALLIAARLNAKKGNSVEAIALYHRAIYGEWPVDAQQQQIAARFELVEFLEYRGQNDAMLAELILLQEEARGDKAMLLKTARLFLAAGSPGHAETAYRSVTSLDPRSAPAYAGLGEVELETGDYRRAQTEFLAAQNRDPGNSSIKTRLELAKSLYGLDPTSRRLPSVEKYRRSLQILELARQDFQSCIFTRPGAPSEDAADLLKKADDVTPKKPPTEARNELAEAVLDVAQQLWRTRGKDCGVPSSPDGDFLRLMMQKLSQ